MRYMSPADLFAACLHANPPEDTWHAGTAYIIDSDLAKLAVRHTQHTGNGVAWGHSTQNSSPPQQAGEPGCTSSSPPPQSSLEGRDVPVSRSCAAGPGHTALAAARGIDVLDQLQRSHDPPPHNSAHTLHWGPESPDGPSHESGASRATPRASGIDASVVSLPAARPKSATLSSPQQRKRRESSGSWKFMERIKRGRGRSAGPARNEYESAEVEGGPPARVAVERVVEDKSRALIWWY